MVFECSAEDVPGMALRGTTCSFAGPNGTTLADLDDSPSGIPRS